MGKQDFEQVIDDLIFALDEPRMGMGSFSQYMVARTAAQRVKVILTGHGGDELFAGYPVFKLIALGQQFRENPLKGVGFLKKVRPSEWPHLIYFLGQKLRRNSASVFLPVLFTESTLKAGLQPEVLSKLRDIEPEAELQRLVNSADDPYHRLTLVYLRAYLPGLFVVEDKISMAHALESRTPLCDNELVDLALSLPLSLKLQSGQLKAIPKAAMRDRLPEILHHMPKRGFPTPLSLWLRHELRDWMQNRILRPDCSLHRLFRPEFLRGFVGDYLSSWRRTVRPLDEIQTHRIWVLLSLEAWLRVSEERLGLRLELN
jgi:asparagine synthase (glutamine-hydrolysing)